jgi:hypothetical protein
MPTQFAFVGKASGGTLTADSSDMYRHQMLPAAGGKT